jgi:hypothetical protein
MKISKSSDPFRYLLFTLFLILLVVSPSGAAVFNCPSGDVACLINAINVANANGEPDTIELAAGVYTLTTVDNFIGEEPFGEPNGLPLITSEITIRGEGPYRTVIRRDPSLGEFFELRIIYVNTTGNLTLDGVAIKGGHGFDLLSEGAGLFNRGMVILKNSIVSENFSEFGTGGIQNRGGTMDITYSFILDNYGVQGSGAINNSFIVDNDGIMRGGTVNIERSTIARNCGDELGGGIANAFGTVTIRGSAIVDNSAGPEGSGGGIVNFGTMRIMNSTIVGNNEGQLRCRWPFAALAVAEIIPAGAGGIFNAGALKVQSSTIARNVLEEGEFFVTGGIMNFEPGTVELQNSIVALNNNGERATDCTGVITSLGNNLIGDISDCNIALLPSDLTGDPGLGGLTDDGTPGNGHLPIIRSSQARNAGDDDSCPTHDQIGNKRKKPCDIGAIEFRQRPPLIVIFENLTDRQSEILIPRAQ